MIELRPFEDLAAMAVFRGLDPVDILEVQAMRGAAQSSLALFAEWRAMQPAALVSLIAFHACTPFAIMGLWPSGQYRVAQAALLARDHARFRRPLVELVRHGQEVLTNTASACNVVRIEARSWANHPRAAALLTALGFAHEADLPGFGPMGRETFRQFAWVHPQLRLNPPETEPETDLPSRLFNHRS